MSRLQTQYKTKILPELKKELKLDSDLAVPSLLKIVVNAGIGRLLQQQPKVLEELLAAMVKITGQKPQSARAKKAIAAFKIRAGQVVGLAVTLRGKRMYDFFDKLVNVALPRSRDFRGLDRSGFDGHGNYNLGLREHSVFPEMAQGEIGMPFSLEVSIVTTARDDRQGYELLKKLGFPFKD